MDKRLSRRLDRIEEHLDPDRGPGLRWPNGDGTFIEVRGVHSLVDLAAIMRGEAHDDRIRHNPTE